MDPIKSPDIMAFPPDPPVTLLSPTLNTFPTNLSVPPASLIHDDQLLSLTLQAMETLHFETDYVSSKSAGFKVLMIKIMILPVPTAKRIP